VVRYAALRPYLSEKAMLFTLVGHPNVKNMLRTIDLQVCPGIPERRKLLKTATANGPFHVMIL